MFSAHLVASVNKAIFNIKSDNQPLPIFGIYLQTSQHPSLTLLEIFILAHANQPLYAGLYI